MCEARHCFKFIFKSTLCQFNLQCNNFTLKFASSSWADTVLIEIAQFYFLSLHGSFKRQFKFVSLFLILLMFVKTFISWNFRRIGEPYTSFIIPKQLNFKNSPCSSSIRWRNCQILILFFFISNLNNKESLSLQKTGVRKVLLHNSFL